MVSWRSQQLRVLFFVQLLVCACSSSPINGKHGKQRSTPEKTPQRWTFETGRWEFEPLSSMSPRAARSLLGPGYDLPAHEHICCTWELVNKKYPAVAHHVVPPPPNMCINPKRKRGMSSPIPAALMPGEVTGHHLASTGARVCLCSAYSHSNHSTEVGRWTWRTTVPDVESVPVWSAEQFCRLLGDRLLYLVGDSTMVQTYGALVNMLITGHAAGAHNCASQVHLCHSDFLTGTPLNAQHKERGRDLAQWLDSLLQPNTTSRAVVVACAAAHMNDLRSYVLMLERNLRFLEKHRGAFSERLRFIWKTINPPHDDCAKQFQPLTTLPDYEPNGYLMVKYGHHGMVRLSDNVARHLFTGKDRLSSVIDMSPLYLRPDAHAVDCLHFCVNRYSGTPLTYFARALLNALLHPERAVV
jgi:hypothetical protein